MNTEKIDIIHESLINGQKTQMVRQIDEYEQEEGGFWEDYTEFLCDTIPPEYEGNVSRFTYLRDVVVAYHRIANRWP